MIKMLFVFGITEVIVSLRIAWYNHGLEVADSFHILAVLKTNAIHNQSVNLMKTEMEENSESTEKVDVSCTVTDA